MPLKSFKGDDWLLNMCVEAANIFQKKKKKKKTGALYLICSNSYDAENVRHFC